MVTGAADNTMRLWKVQTGECLHTWEFATAVKRVACSEDDNKLLAVTEQRMGHMGAIRIFTVQTKGPQSDEPLVEITSTGSKATVAAFSSLDRHIVAGHENGTVSLFNAKSGQLEAEREVHTELITDLQMSLDRTWFVTSSKDKTAKALDVQSLRPLKTFVTETPLNSAAILPHKPFILMGGGQEAMAVTTTSARQGHFEIRFWHRIFEEEVARVKGGFGPCNTIAVHPKGSGYSIGGEDGYVRLHHFDSDFNKSRPYGPLEDEIEN